MGLKKCLNEEEKDKIKVLNSMHLTITQISKEIHRSRGVIRNFLKNPEGYGTKFVTPKCRKLNDRQKRSLVREASKSSSSAMELKKMLNLDASKSTIIRCLRSSGLKFSQQHQHKLWTKPSIKKITRNSADYRTKKPNYQPKQHDIIDLSVKELCQQPPLPPPLLPPLLPPHGLGFQFSSQRSLFASPANIMDKRISYRGQTIVGRDLSVCFSTKSENQEPRQHNLLLTTVQDLPNFRNIEDIGMTSEIREKLLSLLQLDDDSGHMFWDLTDELDSTFGINSLLIKQQINGQFSHVYSEEVGGMMNLYRTYATSLTFIKILTSYLTELSELHQTGMENREFTRMILRKIPLRHAQSFLAVYYYLMEMLHDYARFVKEFEDPMWRDAMSFTNEHLYVELML